MSLMLMIFIALISTLIISVKCQAGRLAAAQSTDQAMESLFARYDRTMLERFDVFLIDGGCGTDSMHAEVLYRRVTDAMEYILEPNLGAGFTGGKNLLDLRCTGGSITAYTLATDAGGMPFVEQAVTYMRETAGLEALNYLEESVQESGRVSRDLENSSDPLKSGVPSSAYQDLWKQSKEKEAEAASAASADGTESGRDVTEGGDGLQKVPDDFVNPLPVIEEVRRRSILDLVMPGSMTVSHGSVERKELLSSREKEQGLGIINTGDVLSGTGRACYAGYLFGHFGSFMSPEEKSKLSYPLEYIIGGKLSDEENLKVVVKKLLVLREASNLVFLYHDPKRYARLKATAAIIASAMLIPEAAPLVQGLLAVGWAYMESLIDVRALLSGQRIPVLKSDAAWQVDVDQIITAAGDPDSLIKSRSFGLDYEEWLRVLMLKTGNETLAARSMDMVELCMRGASGADFRLDLSIDAMEVQMKVESEGLKEWTVTRRCGYREFGT